MKNTIRQYLKGVAGEISRRNLEFILRPIADRQSSVVVASANLVIKAGGSALAKTGSTATVAFVQGVPVSIAAATDMPALVGTVTANSFNFFAFFVDKAGTKTVAMGIEGTALALAKFPPIPEGKACIGFLIVTHSSTFTGGTTPLDTATTIYCSPTGAFDPTILI